MLTKLESRQGNIFGMLFTNEINDEIILKYSDKNEKILTIKDPFLKIKLLHILLGVKKKEIGLHVVNLCTHAKRYHSKKDSLIVELTKGYSEDELFKGVHVVDKGISAYVIKPEDFNVNFDNLVGIEISLKTI